MSDRSRRSRLIAGLGVTAAVAAVLTPGGQAAAEPMPSGWERDTVTLLTGDRVTLVGDRARVRPGPGRGHVTFVQRVDEDGDLHVLPADVAGEVAAGRLDERLFDIDGLIRAGYGDADSAVTPLIVTYDGPAVQVAGAEVRALPSVNGASLNADKATPFLSAARTAGVGKVWLDGPVRAGLDRSVPQIGAPAAWEAGHTGAGTTVAVLDTGIDETHPDLAGAVAESRNFSDSETTDDLLGHGTHVGATITGDGKYKGVAPDSRLLNGKVLDDGGGGYESDIIAGMEWAAGAGADVINMSLGGWATDGTDPMSQALNRITAETGALFVVSAGNSGPSEESVGSPGSADAALTVGAVDRADALAEFSSRGPRTRDGAIKPDITAPGVDIVAAKAANGQIGDPVGDGHVSLSGTSMAAPHVAGAAAVLAGQHPDWTAEQLKSTLMGSAAAHPDLTPYEQGAGRVDMARATGQTVSAAPASLSLGTAQWPHHDDAPIVKTLSYRNSGTAALPLRVAADVRDEAGKPAPAAMVAIAPAEITIPAGGQAEVTVTTTTSLEAADGLYSGFVVAGDGTTSVRTPIGVNKEVESYNVDMTFLDHQGNLTPEYFYRFVDIKNPKAYVNHDPSGTLVARVPKGTFYFDSFVQTMVAENDWHTTEFAEPAITITGDTEMVVDARQGKPVGISVDRPEATMGSAEMFLDMKTEWGGTGHGSFGRDFDGIFVAPSKTTAPGKATFSIASRLAKPDSPDTYLGSPYQYSVGWSHDGGVPSTLDRRFCDRDLVKTRTVAAGPGTGGFLNYMAGGPLPLRVTEYYSRGVAWYSSFDEMDTPDAFPPNSFQSDSMPREVTRPGTRKWNSAVFGPAFPTNRWADQWAARLGDEMRVSVPMFTDQDPNHYGHSLTDTAKTTLHRGDTLLAETDSAGYVSAEDLGGSGAYRLHTEATRSASPLSTQVSADWTFASAPVPGDEPVALPMLAVRFAPSLDEENRAPAGRLFTVPVYVQRNGSTAESVRTPAVQVSYDDGKSWRSVRLVRIGERWHAVLAHPRDAEFVSFKAQARDTQGNSVDQTIIRAYALK